MNQPPKQPHPAPISETNQGYSYRLNLGPDARGESTLLHLARVFNHSSPAQWQHRLNAGEVLLDNIPATGKEILKPGNILIWNRPGWVEAETPQTFTLLHSDEHLLAVDKPSGLPTLPGGGFYQNTLLNLVRKQFPQACPLHRLGRATSGVVLFALDSATASFMLKSWPLIQKQYLALASGVPTENTYDIQTPIGECDHPRLGKVFAANPQGKSARSVARVVQKRSNTTVFEVDLHTGRPHQIRIHLASIGHPLEGDPLYAPGGLPKTDHPGLPGDPGYWLHAQRITFTHPSSNKSMELTAPPPDILRLA